MSASATLADVMGQFVQGEPVGRREDRVLDHARALEQFLAGIERRAFRIAQMSLRDADDALDAVQDAMIQLARNYGQRPAAEWKPLFYRILQNRVHDLQRRRQVRRRVFAWLPGRRDDDEDCADPIEQVAAHDGGPFEQLAGAEAMAALEQALAALPERQRQAFMLRNFEGLDVAGTAAAMGCSDGSVKTHYFRAMQALRAALGEHMA